MHAWGFFCRQWGRAFEQLSQAHIAPRKNAFDDGAGVSASAFYTYVGNDPTDKTDPTGMFSCVSNGDGTSTCTSNGLGDSIVMQVYVAINNAIVHANEPAKPSAPAKPNAPASAPAAHGQGAPAAAPAATPSSGGNTNPYPATGGGPVDQPVVVVDPHGNAIPVNPGEQVVGSPNGDYQQVQDRNGNPTGVRLDRGGHRGQSDPSAQKPHAHVPGVTQPNGNPHLPVCTATPGTPCP